MSLGRISLLTVMIAGSYAGAFGSQPHEAMPGEVRTDDPRYLKKPAQGEAEGKKAAAKQETPKKLLAEYHDVLRIRMVSKDIAINEADNTALDEAFEKLAG